MKYLLPIIVSLLVAGCAKKDMTDLEQWVVNVKARKPTPIDPIPQIRQAETFLYIAGGRRNPFERNIQTPRSEVAGPATGPRPDPNRRKEELEAFPLDSLRMVGTLDKGGQRWALIQTPDRTIHRLRVGNYIGHNDGKIIAIYENKIKVRELIPNGRGGYAERKASLALGKRA